MDWSTLQRLQSNTSPNSVPRNSRSRSTRNGVQAIMVLGLPSKLGVGSAPAGAQLGRRTRFGSWIHAPPERLHTRIYALTQNSCMSAGLCIVVARVHDARVCVLALPVVGSGRRKRRPPGRTHARDVVPESFSPALRISLMSCSWPIAPSLADEIRAVDQIFDEPTDSLDAAGRP